MNRLQEKWATLEPDKREKLARLGILAAVLLGALILYYGSGRDEEDAAQRIEQPQARAISLGDELIEDDLRASMDRQRLEMEEQVAAQRQQLDQLSQQQARQTQAMEALINELNAARTQMADNADSDAMNLPLPNLDFPPPPPLPVPEAADGEPLEHIEPTMIGGILQVRSESIPQEKGADTKKNKVYLGPGFMKAMLLNGIRAKTIEGAEGNPDPMLLRVQAPAVLPNSVKADLKGCFLVANGIGNLGAERVDVRLVSLNCLSTQGDAVIEENIKGFLVDRDGVKGLSGIPVSKMGANLGRAFLAGLVGGLGDAFQADNTTVSISPLGTTTTVQDAGQVLGNGIGRGIADTSADLRKVYLDLVRQTAPVIEVGPSKLVTAVVQEGAWLEIQNHVR